MGYSSDSERPAKRYKRSQPFEQQPAVAHAAPSFAAQAIFGPWSLSANATFSSGSTLRQPWDSWQLPPGLPTTEIFHDLTQIESQQAWGTSVPASISGQYLQVLFGLIFVSLHWTSKTLFIHTPYARTPNPTFASAIVSLYRVETETRDVETTDRMNAVPAPIQFSLLNQVTSLFCPNFRSLPSSIGLLHSPDKTPLSTINSA